MNIWPEHREALLRAQFRRLSGKECVTYAFKPSDETAVIRYFPDSTYNGETEIGGRRFIQVTLTETVKSDIVIVTAHGQNLERELWELRSALEPDGIVVVWLWDNHLAHFSNFKTVLSADVVFFSHGLDQSYLFSPCSAVTAHVPACCAQWTKAEVDEHFAEFGLLPRKSRLLVNYVDYSFAMRGEIIRRVEKEIDNADVFFMPSGDRARYFKKTSREKFGEWSSYKSTIILPITNDLSTRFFDAMLTGLVPIVADCIQDLDKIIPVSMQRELGIVKLLTFDTESIREAVVDAIRLFDELGNEGMIRRHQFIRQHHMLNNRIDQMLDILSRLVDGRVQVEFGDGPHGVALYPVDVV